MREERDGELEPRVDEQVEEVDEAQLRQHRALVRGQVLDGSELQ